MGGIQSVQIIDEVSVHVGKHETAKIEAEFARERRSAQVQGDYGASREGFADRRR
ncbi:unknown protein [Paenibacillus amylolyticus]|uniref:Uncharacterized protein n=1 Tax=Paenibacillus amylolyticus TaxID=1451 RepID=A0A124DXF8_PAEAM|nr:unknown protein [Paenibacillus amylolyticus]